MGGSSRCSASRFGVRSDWAKRSISPAGMKWISRRRDDDQFRSSRRQPIATSGRCLGFIRRARWFIGKRSNGVANILDAGQIAANHPPVLPKRVGVGAVLEHKYRALAVGQRANDGGAARCDRAPFYVRRPLLDRSQERLGPLPGDRLSCHPMESPLMRIRHGEQISVSATAAGGFRDEYSSRSAWPEALLLLD